MEPQMHRSTEETRGGSNEHVVRYVLAASLLLALGTMTVVFLWGSL